MNKYSMKLLKTVSKHPGYKIRLHTPLSDSAFHLSSQKLISYREGLGNNGFQKGYIYCSITQNGLDCLEDNRWFTPQFVITSIVIPIVIAIITTLITIFLSLYL